MLTAKLLLSIMPRCPSAMAPAYAELLNKAAREREITTLPRLACWLGQLAWESDCLRVLEELADGSDYEGRRDLGNVCKGDGPRYKGRGFIQITGHANYSSASLALDVNLVQTPELASEPEFAARIAAWFWASHGCNERADAGDIEGITHVINGGLSGLDGRRDYTIRAFARLSPVFSGVQNG